MNWMRLNVVWTDSAQRAHRERLGEAGHALEQHVPAGEEGDQQPVDHGVLADDALRHFVDDGLSQSCSDFLCHEGNLEG